METKSKPKMGFDTGRFERIWRGFQPGAGAQRIQYCWSAPGSQGHGRQCGEHCRRDPADGAAGAVFQRECRRPGAPIGSDSGLSRNIAETDPECGGIRITAAFPGFWHSETLYMRAMPPARIKPADMNMTLDVMAHSLVYWTQELFAAGLLGRERRFLP